MQKNLQEKTIGQKSDWSKNFQTILQNESSFVDVVNFFQFFWSQNLGVVDIKSHSLTCEESSHVIHTQKCSHKWNKSDECVYTKNHDEHPEQEEIKESCSKRSPKMTFYCFQSFVICDKNVAIKNNHCRSPSKHSQLMNCEEKNQNHKHAEWQNV